MCNLSLLTTPSVYSEVIGALLEVVFFPLRLAKQFQDVNTASETAQIMAEHLEAFA